MRGSWFAWPLILFAGVFAGCSGGGATQHCLAGDPFCNSAHTTYSLETVPMPFWLTSPIPVGASVDITFIERKCITSSSESPGARGGCGAPYVPASLTGRVMAMANTGAVCPVTVVQKAPGVVRITRTGPGDPTIHIENSSGFCSVWVSDPTNGAQMSALYI